MGKLDGWVSHVDMSMSVIFSFQWTSSSSHHLLYLLFDKKKYGRQFCYITSRSLPYLCHPSPDVSARRCSPCVAETWINANNAHVGCKIKSGSVWWRSGVPGKPGQAGLRRRRDATPTFTSPHGKWNISAEFERKKPARGIVPDSLHFTSIPCHCNTGTVVLYHSDHYTQ